MHKGDLFAVVVVKVPVALKSLLARTAEGVKAPSAFYAIKRRLRGDDHLVGPLFSPGGPKGAFVVAVFCSGASKVVWFASVLGS